MSQCGKRVRSFYQRFQTGDYESFMDKTFRYGFKKAYTTLDVLAWDPSYVLFFLWPSITEQRFCRVWPFHDLDDVERASVQVLIARIRCAAYTP